MDPKSLRERDFIIDLESGTDSTIDVSGVTGSRFARAKELFNRVWSSFVSTGGSIEGENPGGLGYHLPPFVEGPVLNAEASAEKMLGGEEKVGLLEKKAGAKKPKKKGSKKPPKPPRPPKSQSLDAADQKLVREISELAMLKRARMERMKALKKMKNAKPTSSSSNLCALVITVTFCIVIIWQGVFYRGSSPDSSAGTGGGGLISVQFYRNLSTDGPWASSSASPNNVEQVSGLDSHGEASRIR